MGELLKAAVGCIEPPTLFERELHILAEIARRADDITGPVLAANGTVRQARTGRVEHPGGGQFTERVRWGVVESRLFVFTATGWLQAVDDPAEDGAYQLNVARLPRLLDVAEAGLASGAADPGALERADRELPGDFEADAPAGLAEQIDRILVSNPAT